MWGWRPRPRLSTCPRSSAETCWPRNGSYVRLAGRPRLMLVPPVPRVLTRFSTRGGPCAGPRLPRRRRTTGSGREVGGGPRAPRGHGVCSPGRAVRSRPGRARPARRTPVRPRAGSRRPRPACRGVTAVSGAGVYWRSSVWFGMRPATAVRMAPQLAWWSRARPAMDWPPRYPARTAAAFAAVTAGQRPPLLPSAAAARSPWQVSSRWRSPAAARVCNVPLTTSKTR